MNQTQVIESLRTDADKLSALKDTLFAFAMRERARHEITLVSLVSRMKKEGFDHSRHDYVEVLKLLAKAGIGRLDLDPKGRVRGLKEVKTTLQSIGAAALGESARLEIAKRRNRFGKFETTLVQTTPPVLVVAPEPKAEIVLNPPKRVKSGDDAYQTAFNIVKATTETDEPTKAIVEQHEASAVNPKIRPRVQPRPGAGVWLVLAVLLKDGSTFKTHVPEGLTKDDARRIGQALAEVAQKP